MAYLVFPTVRVQHVHRNILCGYDCYMYFLVTVAISTGPFDRYVWASWTCGFQQRVRVVSVVYRVRRGTRCRRYNGDVRWSVVGRLTIAPPWATATDKGRSGGEGGSDARGAHWSGTGGVKTRKTRIVPTRTLWRGCSACTRFTYIYIYT